MNHDETFELLSDYHDGELAPALRSKVDGHLQACAACRRELARYRRFDAAISAMPEAPTPIQTEAFRRSVLDQLESPPAVSIFAGWLASPRIAVPAFAFALTALILALGPARTRPYGLADGLLIYQDDGRTYSWLVKSDASTANVFDWSLR